MRLFYLLSDFMKEKFGCRVFKVSIDAGFTCPNKDGSKGFGGCIYCETAALLPKGFEKKRKNPYEQLTEGMEKVRKRHKVDKFIAYFQYNTNSYSPIDELESVYRQAIGHEDVAGLAISTRPDCVDEKILKLLADIKKEKHVWLELGLQSSNDRTLEAINRGHTAKDFAEAALLARSFGIDVCAHIIIGLPGEENEDIIETVKFLRSLKVWGVKFHQLQVLRGTELEKMHMKGEIKTLGLDEYASLVVKCLELLPPEIVIHRLCADTPNEFLLAPKWGMNKFLILEKITGLMLSQGSFQGKGLTRAGGVYEQNSDKGRY